jgi:hypothetical protein
VTPSKSEGDVDMTFMQVASPNLSTYSLPNWSSGLRIRPSSKIHPQPPSLPNLPHQNLQLDNRVFLLLLVVAHRREEDQPGGSGEAGQAGSPERVVEVPEEHDMYIDRSTPKRHLQCPKNQAQP